MRRETIDILLSARNMLKDHSRAAAVLLSLFYLVNTAAVYLISVVVFATAWK